MAQPALNLRDKKGEHILPRLVDTRLEAQVETLDDTASLDAHKVAVGISLVENQREYIGLNIGGVDDEGLAVVLRERIQPLFVMLGPFEIQAGGAVGHRLFVLPHQFPAPAFQNAFDSLHPAGVFFFGNLAHATARASSRMQFQAGTVFAAEDAIGSEFQFAVGPAHRIEGEEEFQQGVGVLDGTVRPEIAVFARLVHPSRQKDAGERLVAHANPRIGLGVLEQDVVLGLVLLDEVVLQKEGIGLAVYYRKLGVGYLGNQNTRFGIQALGRHKILGHTLVKVFCLAHIDNFALGVIVAVNTGSVRKKGYFFPNSHTLAYTKVRNPFIFKKNIINFACYFELKERT